MLTFQTKLLHIDKQIQCYIKKVTITVDFEEVKTAPTECKEKCFQMSHLPIFTILKHLKMCWC